MAGAAKVLVLGSNSFSGASFIDFLLHRGVTVTGISRSPEAHRVFLPYRWSGTAANFSFHQCDLNHELDRLMSIVNTEKPDFIINFAAQSMFG